MHRFIVRAAILAIILIVSPVVSGASELWERAVGLYGEYGELVPGRMSIRFDQYNGRGKLVSSESSEYEIALGPSGEIEGQIIYATKDGEDVTENRQEANGTDSPFGGESGDEENTSPFDGLQKSPFDPAEQESVSVVDTGRSEVIDGVQTRVLRFEFATGGDNRTTGTAWIAESTGAPVRLSAAIEPLPGFIDLFRMDQSFATDGDGRWFMTRMEFVGEGNILFVRRRIESEFEFSDYFLPPPQPLN